MSTSVNYLLIDCNRTVWLSHLSPTLIPITSWSLSVKYKLTCSFNKFLCSWFNYATLPLFYTHHIPGFIFAMVIIIGLPYSSDGRESACNTGNLGSIPRSGRSPGEGNGNPLQYSCLENLMDRGVLQVIVHGVTKSQTQLND